jgi:hypothetical protein
MVFILQLDRCWIGLCLSVVVMHLYVFGIFGQSGAFGRCRCLLFPRLVLGFLVLVVLLL